MAYTTEQLRNIALAGHAFAGKTTLVEAILHEAKVIGRRGTVEEGTTVSDFEPEEKQHKHSLNASIVNFDYEGKHFNVIDTPGYPDFIGQAVSVFPAVETVAVVVGADRGVQNMTRRLMAIAGERRLARMIIVNKIDEHVGRLEELLEHLRETFGPECLPINLPTPDGSDVVDLWEHSDGKVAFMGAGEGHRRLVEQVIDVDEELMARYLEQEKSVTVEQLHDAFERALRESHLIPVLFCSAKTGAGLADLLHLMANLAPNPLEGNPPPYLMTRQDGQTIDWYPTQDLQHETLAHVFKITSDQFVGKMSFARVHQGKITAGASLCLDDAKKPVRIGHIFRVRGKDHTEMTEAIPGDIIAIPKVEELHFNGVLHASHDLDSLKAKPMPLPRPMYGQAVETKNKADEAKFGQILAKMAEEDPTFTIDRVAATHETVVRGMGELHLRVVFEKLKGKYKLDLDHRAPKVAYKETITSKADGHHRHKKQTGGAGQFGEVYLRVEPLPSDHPDGFEFVSEVVGGTVPRQYWPAVEKGCRQVMADGAIAGYPMTGVRVVLYDGKYHDVDSKEVAFVTAGKRAFIDAVTKAKPVLMEPWVSVEITAPSGKMGDIAADISGKRGQVQSTDMLPGDQMLVKATVPLAEMSAYSNQLKSMTGGQGSFVMDYSHFERTPPSVQQSVVAAFKPRAEED
ncbi:MAG: elongation factor G [Phycisphaerales bacterium]|nr:elongation factor G [Phycisphaerales bacterium]